MEMNGKMIVRNPLYVALAQCKEDRRSRLQAQFSQMRPVGPRMPMYHPGAASLGQKIYYGQAPPVMMQPGIHPISSTMSVTKMSPCLQLSRSLHVALSPNNITTSIDYFLC
ncbi:polyadenylate-binding protein 8-like [Silene latifolia]|uniref:polyadenylate-binding protein 8-like n=1 Tax=Silene latifolia TaxID=37657 RepID=UPI003D781429